MHATTFGAQVIDFYDNLQVPETLPSYVEAIHPHANTEVKTIAKAFFNQFFNDTKKRVFVLGINPGRFGSGVTGIPFTDPVALFQNCNIRSTFSLRRELTSQFVYTFIEEWGGADAFYQDFFLTAISPIGFTRNGTNFNYYDDLVFFGHIKPFIAKTLREQIGFGARRTAIVLGTGKNLKAFNDINKEFAFFDTVLAVEHPRFVMQYRKKHLNEYLQKYHETFAKALVS